MLVELQMLLFQTHPGLELLRKLNFQNQNLRRREPLKLSESEEELNLFSAILSFS